MLGFDDDEWMGWHNDIGSGQGVGGARAGNFDSSAPLMMQVGWDDNSARRNYTKNGVPWTENKGGEGGEEEEEEALLTKVKGKQAIMEA